MTHATSVLRLTALLLAGAPAALQAQFGTQRQQVETPPPPPITAIDDIRYLSDDRLQGRMTGSPGLASPPRRAARSTWGSNGHASASSATSRSSTES